MKKEPKKRRKVKEALALLPAHQDLPSTEEIQSKRISGLKKKMSTVLTNFYVLLPEGT